MRSSRVFRRTPLAAVLESRLWVLLAAVFVLALGLRLLLLWAWYTEDYLKFQSGDYTLYSVGAEHIRDQGDFSNSLFLVRPPLFSLAVLALHIDDGRVLVFNAVIGALIAPLTVLLSRTLRLPQTAGGLAGLLVALDPSSIVFSTFLGPEPLANGLLLASVIVLLRAVMGTSGPRQAFVWGTLAGVLLGLSALTRPASYLLWIVLAGWMLLVHRRRWPAIASYATCAAFLIGLWVVHNARTFDYATFSTISPYTMAYYRAASVEHLGTGHDMNTVYASINQRVEDRLGRGRTDVDAEARHGYLAASPTVARALNEVSLDIFKKYPHLYLATFPVGFARMYGLVTTDMARTSLPARLLEMAWNASLVLLTMVGLWQAYRHKQWLLFWGAVLFIGYFTGGTLLMKSAGMTARERSMLTPWMAVASAYALVVWARGGGPRLAFLRLKPPTEHQAKTP